MNRTVLIVDDDPDLAHAITIELERMSLEVVYAPHYDAAVRALSSTHVPRLVCVDLELPTRSGYDLCEYIRGAMRRVRVPILVMSDSAFPEEMAHAEEAGADAFMKKPFSLRDFGAYIESLLASTRASELDEPRVEA